LKDVFEEKKTILKDVDISAIFPETARGKESGGIWEKTRVK